MAQHIYRIAEIVGGELHDAAILTQGDAAALIQGSNRERPTDPADAYWWSGDAQAASRCGIR